MWKNYLKIAWRNLTKNRVFSFINILGLSVGVGACLLILNFVLFEFSYDSFHRDANQIYRITGKAANEHQEQSILTPPPLGPELKRSINGITHSARLILPWSGQAATSTLGFFGDHASSVKQNFKWGFFTDPDFFQLFDFKMLAGDPDQALMRQNTIVLSESAAEKLYGPNWKNLEILGKSLEYVNEFDRFYLEVTGIILDAPENSHFQYDFLASFSTLSTGWGRDYAETWGGNGVYTYLKISPGADPYLLESQIQKFVSQNADEDTRTQLTFGLQAMEDIHLRSNFENELKVNGNISRVYFLLALALLIMLVAIANYINLSIAKSISKGCEVGVRKLMGATRSQLIRQFLAESLILVLISLSFAILILFVSKPFYFQLTGFQIELSEVRLWMLIIVCTPLLALFSGIYPAFILSGFDPIRLVNGKSASISGSFNLRKSLVVIQFTIAIVMVSFTTIMFLQTEFLKTSDPGFSKDGVIVLKGPSSRTETWIEHDQKPKTEADELDAFKDKVLQFAGVEEASLSWSVPGEGSLSNRVDLGETYQNSTLDLIITDNDYANVYGIPVLAGSYTTDDGVVINESALKILGFESPEKAIGMTYRDYRGLEYRVNGVVRDYHHSGFRKTIGALVFAKNDPSYKLDSFYSLKVNQANLNQTLKELKIAFTSVYPSDSFDYFFMDSHFEAQYENENNFAKIFGIFAIMAIFIGCLGLFGLAMQAVLERSKEIGIRKVLGAEAGSIVGLVSKDFIQLTLIAMLIAMPLAWLVIDKWLAGFAYRTEILWWVFPLAGIGVVTVALITVGTQTMRAALMNPVKSLRSE